jgi:hypothetical protein
LVFNTIISWMTVPEFVTTNFTFPAGTVAGETVIDIGPAKPAVSVSVTVTTDTGFVAAVAVVDAVARDRAAALPAPTPSSAIIAIAAIPIL